MLLLTLGATTGAAAQAPAWTLGEVYRRLEEASPALGAARARAAAAEARIAPARRPPDPQLQLGLMNRELPGLGLSDPLGMTQIQLMQMIPFPGKLGRAGRVAEAGAGADRARVEAVHWELRSRAAMAFHETRRLDRSIEVAVETQGLLRDIAATARAMYQVGEGRQADVLRAQVEVDRMTDEIVRMRAMRDGELAALNALLDRPAGAEGGAAALPVFPAELPPLDSLLDAALADRPMLLAGREEVRGAEASYALARREIWPDFQLGLVYGQRPMAGGGTERMASFMLGINLPLFAGSRQLRMRVEADAMRDMARADLAAMAADTRARTTALHATLRRSRELRDLYRTTLLPQAEAMVTSALAAYRAGQVNLMTLLDSQMTVNRYRQDVLQLEADEGVAWAEMEMLVGRPLFDSDRIQTEEGAPR